jgi:hypothetical protein
MRLPVALEGLRPPDSQFVARSIATNGPEEIPDTVVPEECSIEHGDAVNEAAFEIPGARRWIPSVEINTAGPGTLRDAVPDIVELNNKRVGQVVGL